MKNVFIVCVAIAILVGCSQSTVGHVSTLTPPQTTTAGGGFEQSSGAPRALARTIGEPSRISFKILSVQTLSGWFVYSNGFAERVINAGQETLTIHRPRSRVSWSTSVIKKIHITDSSGANREIVLNSLTPVRHPFTHGSQPIVCASCGPGGGGGGGGGECEVSSEEWFSHGNALLL